MSSNQMNCSWIKRNIHIKSLHCNMKRRRDNLIHMKTYVYSQVFHKKFPSLEKVLFLISE